MNDAEFHAAALAYAKKFNKNYAEAARAVAELDAVVMAGKQLPAEPATGKGTPLSDAELDSQAKAYAKENNLSYAEAISAVCSFGSVSYAASGQMVSFSQNRPMQVNPAVARAIEHQLVEIFKAGRHTADDGQTLDFSPSDIRSMASTYNPAMREAPLVVGHPQSNLPAYGWVKGLEATDDGRLMMRAGQVEPAFAQMVQDGRFKKRSASFYHPSSPGNPRPGQWYLRHVGFLGAQPPAVSGLKDIQFATPLASGEITFSALTDGFKS